MQQDPQDQEDDEIIKEIDVFYNNENMESVYLFQYPNRDHITLPPTAQFKPMSNKMKFEIPLNSNPSHYSMDRAAELGKGLPEGSGKILKSFDLVSSEIPMNATYMAGLIKPDGLYLTPISSILQFRPSFDYLDQMVENEKAAEKAFIDDSMEEEVNVEDAKLVHLTVRSSEDAETLKKMEQMENLKKQDEEEWITMKVYDADSLETRQQIEKIFQANTDSTMDSISYEEYLDMICPKQVKEKSLNPSNSEETLIHGLTLNDMENMELKNKVLGVLANAHIVSMDFLTDFLSFEGVLQDLITALEQVAYCIRGNWILQSHYLYSHTRILNARNHLLYLFACSESVNRMEFNQVAKLPLDLSKFLFEEMAVLDKSRNAWTLKLPSQTDFIKRNGPLLKKHKELLTSLNKEALKSLKTVAGGSSSTSKNFESTGPSKQPRQPTTIAGPSVIKKESLSMEIVQDSKALASTEQGETNKIEGQEEFPVFGSNLQEQLTHFIICILRKHQVCSLAVITQLVNARKADTNLKGNLINKTVNKEMIVKILDNISYCLRGIYLLKEAESEELVGAREKAIDAFRRKKICRQSEIQKKIKDSGIEYVPTLSELETILESFAERVPDASWKIRETIIL